MLEKDNVYFGFKFKSQEKITEINSTVLIFEHIKTGARVLKIKNSDNEKCFAVGFKTLPKDNTGVFHIIEHSVLCGTKKYPIKDPFATLAKSTINSFLNAWTFPDKTVYPFATTNSQEYFKLMDVYLDSVFNPNIYDNKSIFLQEGWRKYYDEKNDELKIKGVVFGEMMGANSSPDSLIDRHSMRKLYPDTGYSYNSGGDSEEIYNLSYEDFLETHKKYYNPSNSYFYFYGNENILTELEFVEKNYLSNFNEKIPQEIVAVQNPFNEEVVEKIPYYNENIQKTNFLSYNWSVGNTCDVNHSIEMEVLFNILAGMNSSPLKKAILKSKICEDFTASIDNEESPTIRFNVTISNVNKQNTENFKNLIYVTLNDFIKSDIHPDLILAAINKCEFELREVGNDEHLPNGIHLMREVFKTWLHNSENPTGYLYYEDALAEVKKNFDNHNYVKDLVKIYFIENNHKCLVELDSQNEKNFADGLKYKLEIEKSEMSDEDLDNLKNQEEKVLEFQNAEENISKIPELKSVLVEKIDKNIKKIDLIDTEEEMVSILQYKTHTNGICYFNFLFDLRVIDKELISVIGLLPSILSDVRTSDISYEEFSNLENIVTGGISINILNLENENDGLIPKLLVSVKCIEDNSDDCINLMKTFFNDLVFDTPKILEILNRIKSKLEVSIVENGHYYATTYNNSKMSNYGMFDEQSCGISFYEFVCDIINSWDENGHTLMENIREIYHNVFNRQNLIININSNSLKTDFIKSLHLKGKFQPINDYVFDLNDKNVAFVVNSQVNYVSQNYNFKKFGFEYLGVFEILRKLLGYGFLWEEIRMKGGAYGAYFGANKKGGFNLATYRDPNIKQSIDTFKKVSEFVKNIDLSSDEINQLIVGAVSELDTPMLKNEEGLQKTVQILSGITNNKLQKTRDEILNVTISDIQKTYEIFEKVIQKNNISVVGNYDKINEDMNLFDEIRKI